MGNDEDGAFERIRSLVRRRRGVDLGHYRRAYVQRRLLARMRARGAAAPAEYARLLARDADEIARLVGALSTTVTSFFRNPGLYDWLERNVLPDLLAAAPGRLVRLWSAGCATGEEAWSLVLLAARHAPPPPDGRVRVLGTDIDRKAVAAARRGVYPRAGLRAVPPPLRRRFVESAAGGATCRVEPALAPYVSFRAADLLDPPAAGAFDLVLCRNVLIYFDPPRQQAILANLARGLRPGGWLALGRVERIAGAARALFEPASVRERVYRRP